MARVRHDEVDKYGGQGGAGFFQLKEDKEVAQVRFMYASVDDIVGDTVHEIDMVDENGRVLMGKNGRPRKRYVNCLRDYKDPVDVCPFCREGKYTVVKLFIPIYNIDEDKVQIWERGKTWFKKLTSMASRYPNMVGQIFEIERDGASGDQQTQYNVYPIGQPDDTTLEDLPAMSPILGNHVLDKTAEDMEYYLTEGQFPPTDDDTEEARPVRRRGGKQEEEAPVRRRTPSRRSNEDVY